MDTFQAFGVGAAALLAGGSSVTGAIIAWRTFSATALKERRDADAQNQLNLEKVRNDEEKLRLVSRLESETGRNDAELAQLRREAEVARENYENQRYETHKKNGVIEQYQVMVDQYKRDLARLDPDGTDSITGEPYRSPSAPP